MLRATLLCAAALLSSAPALGGLFQELYRGLDIYATPSGFPVSTAEGGGRANGARFGRLRVVPNDLGSGYRLELDRTFGVDTRGRPEVFDLGNLELQLSGATQATLGFTRRGLPTANAEFLANNLNYALRGKTGGQDFELVGALSVVNRLEVNPLGFYSLEADITNSNSSLTADGVLVDGDVDTDWDIGPISVRGNIYYDVALALLTSFGANTEDLEGVFPASPIDVIDDQIEAALREQANVLGETLIADVESETHDIGSAFGPPAADLAMLSAADAAPGSISGGQPIPESTSVILLVAGGLFALRRRR